MGRRDERSERGVIADRLLYVVAKEETDRLTLGNAGSHENATSCRGRDSSLTNGKIISHCRQHPAYRRVLAYVSVI